MIPPRRVIAIANQKGGVGKTTTAINLGAALARRGHAVLLVDLDAQTNCTAAFADVTTTNTIYGMLFAGVAIERAIATTMVDGVQLIPGDVRMAEAEGELFLEGNSRRLRDLLAPITDRTIILDCPPNLGHLVVGALVAADVVLVPIAGHSWSVAGLRRIVEQCQQIATLLDVHPQIRVLRTLVDRTRLSRQVAAELSELALPVYDTVIRRSQALADASVARQTIFTYAPTSYGAIDYAQLAEEMEGKDLCLSTS